MIKPLAAAIYLTALTTAPAGAADSGPKIERGAVSYPSNSGERRTIDLGRRCTDLWVSPDESAFAFVAVDEERPPRRNPVLGHDEGPLIQRSTIFIAPRSGGVFSVKPVNLRAVIVDGRQWSVLREPILSPDTRTVYFSVPRSMTSSAIFSASLDSGRVQSIADAVNYCVIWNGPYSGSLMLERRLLPENVDQEISYPCYTRDPSGKLHKVANDCSDFEAFANSWVSEGGGSCPLPEDTFASPR